MEPLDEVAHYLQGSLLERLRKIAAEEEAAKTKVAAAPAPLPPRDPPPLPLMKKVAELSPAEKAARLERGTTAIHVLADMLYGPREGQEQKLAAVIAGETFKVAAMDLVDWSTRSDDVIQSVLQQAGVKTAADNDRITADYVGRLLAHGLYARHLEAIGACR